ncbi:MAG: DUF1800 family protein [Deltaproteobacteria bacterium]|nr:DUF1800 family protein [Deltaproteobacteria bacterium]
MVHRYFRFLLACLVLCNASLADAAQKKKKKADKPILIQQSDVFANTVSVKIGKKRKNAIVYCLDKTPGGVKESSQGLVFTSFSKSLAALKAKRITSGTKVATLKALQKQGAKICAKPEFLSLSKYRGAFGEEQARALFDRFAFGASPERIAQAVQEGLETTVNRLTTYAAEPALDAVEDSLRCDGRFPGDPDKEICEGANDVNFTGVRYGLYYRYLKSQNPLFEKLFQFVHDERLSANSNALDGCERYALANHINMIRRLVRGGSYVDYMREWNTDLMGHLEYLDGASNRGDNPNENYAREFWELGTVGPTDLNGAPVYTDNDIAQAALAFSGWRVYYDNPTETCVRSYSPDLHAPGPKVIFQGTPYQAVVYDAEDVLRATFNHPRTAENLAEDLWKEFINPFPTSPAIKELAAVIRGNNYNLLATVKTMMLSQALQADRSKKSLIKHPVELLFGFLRTTGIPLADSTYWYFEYRLSQMGQVPLLPPTIFGWNPERLAGEAFVLEWRNTSLQLILQNADEMRDLGFDFKQRFLTGLSTSGTPSMAVIDRMSKWMNISLNAAQKAILDQYMNYSRVSCYQDCNGQPTKVERDVFDGALDGDGEFKLRGLLNILATSNEYRMK